MSPRGVYAYVCSLCDHYASGHGLAPGGELVAGPYRCRQPGCTCEMSQKTPTIELNRAQYVDRERSS